MRMPLLVRSVQACLFLLSMGPVSASSQSPPKMAGNLELLGLTLGSNTLADAQAKFGKSPTRRCSREEEAADELCYESAGKDHTKVVFEAGFSGGWTQLDGFKVIAGDLEPRCYRQCPTAGQISAEVRTAAGLRLGMTRDELIALLGTPTQVRGDRLSFQWQSRLAMTKEEKEAESKTFQSPVTDAYYDVQDTIDVTLENSKVAEFEIRHIVTY